jgi:cyclic beta-1,2-glucan synthetase
MAARPLEPVSRVLVGAASILSFLGCLAALVSADRLGNPPLALLFVAAAGVAGLALAQLGLTHRPPGWRDIAWEIAVLAAIAVARDARWHVWQSPGQWLDLLRLSTVGALAAGGIYVVCGASVQAREGRHLSWHESLSLLGLPFLFNLLLALPATGLMRELGQGASLGLAPAVAAAAVGRALVLGLFLELLVIGLGFSKTGRLPRDPRLHLLIWGSAAHAVLTPQIAAAPQFAAPWPLLGIIAAPLAAALAQAGLWAFVFVASGLTIDAVAGRPPVFASARTQWRKGFRNGAIYGAVFGAMALLWGGWLAISPLLAADHWASVLLAGLVGAAVFPFLATLVASADETPPFFPRLWRNYRNGRLCLRGIFIGLCVSFAFAAGLPDEGGLTRFLLSFGAGALAYAGIELACDALSIRFGGTRVGARRKLDYGRVYLLYAGLGGFVGGALGWYFDAAQIGVVAAKFRA